MQVPRENVMRRTTLLMSTYRLFYRTNGEFRSFTFTLVYACIRGQQLANYDDYKRITGYILDHTVELVCWLYNLAHYMQHLTNQWQSQDNNLVLSD
jgi:hypothetical protein